MIKAAKAARRVFVTGVGMTKFEKPGRRDDFDYPQMAEESVGKALQDAKVNYKDIEQAFVGYVFGDSTCGQRALYQMGLTGIPIFNVNNNCYRFIGSTYGKSSCIRRSFRLCIGSGI